MESADLTPAQRAAIRKTIVAAKRFWCAPPGAAEDHAADQLIGAVVDLAEEMDREPPKPPPPRQR